MSSHTIRAAFELVDTEPSNEFLSSLRAELLATLEGSDTGDEALSQSPNALPLSAFDEYVELAPDASRVFQNRRFARTLLAAAACLAVFATGASAASLRATSSGHIQSAGGVRRA